MDSEDKNVMAAALEQYTEAHLVVLPQVKVFRDSCKITGFSEKETLRLTEGFYYHLTNLMERPMPPTSSAHQEFRFSP